jgi:hypothetical protein
VPPTWIRFGDYQQEVSIKYDRISLNDVVESTPSSHERIQLRAVDVYQIIRPYVTPRFLEQFKAVAPLALYLVVFQLLLLRQPVVGGWAVAAALLAVVIGLMVFMEGLKLGLMPLGGRIGETLPAHSPLPVVLVIVFLLGVGVTFAEPAIGALKAAGSIVERERSPLLFSLLNEQSHLLVLVVGAGVGLAAVLGTMRFVREWSLKPLIYATLVPLLLLTAYAQLNPDLREVVGLAWDSGAVSTGPVTVPLVLALGIGVASSVGRGRSSLAGFGIVTLASLFPVMAVLLLAIVIDPSPAPVMVTEVAPRWFEVSPVVDLIGAARAIVPLVIFLLLVLRVVVRKPVGHPAMVAYGIVLCLVGMMVFNVGLTFGLAELGNQSGGLLPAAFTSIEAVGESPLYYVALGIVIVGAFAWFLGFGATLAEPALNALGLTVEELTNGAFPKRLLMMAVSIGVGCGITLGVIKLVYGVQLGYLLVPGYALLLLLTHLSSEEFVNVAWDSAGVTTGPVTVPLVLAMGLGLGDAVRAPEGFGVLAMASLCPIVSVLSTGLFLRWKSRRRELRNGEIGDHVKS